MFCLLVSTVHSVHCPPREETHPDTNTDTTRHWPSWVTVGHWLSTVVSVFQSFHLNGWKSFYIPLSHCLHSSMRLTGCDCPVWCLAWFTGDQQQYKRFYPTKNILKVAMKQFISYILCINLMLYEILGDVWCVLCKESTNLFVQDWAWRPVGFPRRFDATAPVDYTLDCSSLQLCVPAVRW